MRISRNISPPKKVRLTIESKQMYHYELDLRATSGCTSQSNKLEITSLKFVPTSRAPKGEITSYKQSIAFMTPYDTFEVA